MKMKRITASNIKEAMALARRELGEDAVLIDNRSAPSGGVIVTFAIDQQEEPLILPDEELSIAEIAPFTPEIPKSALAGPEITHPAQEIIAAALSYHNVPPKLGERLLMHVMQSRMKADHVLEVAEHALAQALTAHLSFKPIATADKTLPKRALMLVGPHGAGKTSTIAKLATELTLNKQRVVLVSTDTERLGGAESLHLLAELLRCEVVVSDSRNHLKALLASLLGKAWILVDSSGANIYEFAQLKGLGELAGLQAVEPILTCAAGMDTAEAQEMAGVFNFLPIERMIVTRLDAVRRLGSLFAALTTGGYSLSNISNSALPTDACQPISAAGLSRLMLRQVRERMTH